MKTYFKAFGYDPTKNRVTYEAEYMSDIAVEPMYRFLINMNHTTRLPYGLVEARRFSHVQHFNTEDYGHLSVVFGLGEEAYNEDQYMGPLRDDEIELKARIYEHVWFWEFTLLPSWEKSLELFGDIVNFVNTEFPKLDESGLIEKGQIGSANATKVLAIYNGQIDK